MFIIISYYHRKLLGQRNLKGSNWFSVIVNNLKRFRYSKVRFHVGSCLKLIHVDSWDKSFFRYLE